MPAKVVLCVALLCLGSWIAGSTTVARAEPARAAEKTSEAPKSGAKTATVEKSATQAAAAPQKASDAAPTKTPAAAAPTQAAAAAPAKQPSQAADAAKNESGKCGKCENCLRAKALAEAAKKSEGAQAAKSAENAKPKGSPSDGVKTADGVSAAPGKVQTASLESEKAKFELIAIEKAIVERTNAQRARYGLPPLEIDEELMQGARTHANWMTLNQRLIHTSQPVAENIAMGQQDSDEVLQSWMNSSGHRANILNGAFRRIGVAAYRTIGGTIYWCQQFRH